ncbi:hypothetical protein PGUG_02278 [Meyerozyma guilliermondii ATCC 6260]|uniref:Autophagy-related protein 25 n=1 Tax=Meyerozyma guilliermondii (strain ATCC 6260 / CBS 566 / DSM 6381 / JCM 1539 / NBRC 10279 / NRRL Y-324) TaxID=294746 RepID=A5DG77_PICGU|nr:uncharacterized protein PGUG_02278 [Meyerozyma guilliermondii ATCC 6260]EDK38180.2 hypothetical protein PGUG_02278 [Meyerozyma guilliermondii ATCC 6260]
MSYLDIESLRNAADLINSTLLSKGYVDEKLYFNTIDWSHLSSDQPQQVSLETTDVVYNNDKNIINIVFSLLKSIERNKAQNQAFNRQLSQKDATIANLNKKIDQLTTQVSQQQMQISKLYQFDHTQLNKKVQSLTQINKLQSQDLNRLNNWCKDIKTKYGVEIRRRNIEITSLKSKLLEKRNLSSTLTMGLPYPSPDTATSSHDLNETVNPNIIYNNTPIVNNAASSTALSPRKLTPIVSQEYETIANSLTEMVQNLIRENYKFSKFLSSINNYVSNLNNGMSSTLADVPSPSEIVDLRELTSEALNSVSSKDLNNDIEAFEPLAKPFLNNIYKHYHNVVELVELKMANYGGAYSSETVDKLEKELEIVRKNWQDSLKTLEEWKQYKGG